MHATSTATSIATLRGSTCDRRSENWLKSIEPTFTSQQSQVGQDPHVRLDAACQRVEAVAAFEHRHDAALRIALGDVAHPPGDPGEVVFVEAQLAEIVFAV